MTERNSQAHASGALDLLALPHEISSAIFWRLKKGGAKGRSFGKGTKLLSEKLECRIRQEDLRGGARLQE